MAELTLLNESTVTASEIDGLGHMNVRFYMSRVAAANQALLKLAGLMPSESSGDQFIRRLDTYSRFRKEQFEGASLHTLGGFISTERGDEPAKITAYFEIRNPDTTDVAASFIVTSGIVDVVSRQLVEPAISVDPDSSYFVDVPDAGKPRSLVLSTPKQVEYSELDALIPDGPTPGMMSGRFENVVYAEDCDDEGRLLEDIDLMFAMHRQDPEAEEVVFGPPELHDEHGRRYSWAMMEVRSLVVERPMAGDQLISLGADIAFGEKWRQSRRWMFVKDTGKLLGISDSVGVCIDLDARCAIPNPAEVREAIGNNLLPHLA
jgi:acyl-CoA thioester hydrolase